MSGLHIIWFQSDLRLHDHAALRAACLAATRDGGQVLPLFIAHPEVWQANAIQLPARFVLESLKDLQAALAVRGAPLHIRASEPVSSLSDIHRAHGIHAIYQHQPTEPSAQTDLQAWSMRAGIALRTFEPNMRDISVQGRVAWLDRWQAYMMQPRHQAPDRIEAANIGIGQFPDPDALAGIQGVTQIDTSGGRKPAIQLLKGFLSAPGDLSSLATMRASAAEQAYKKLQPYLTLGVLSVRELWQAATMAQDQYQRAGHEIRMATVASFLRFLADDSYAAAKPAARRSVTSTDQHRSRDNQLSLDLL